MAVHLPETETEVDHPQMVDGGGEIERLLAEELEFAQNRRQDGEQKGVGVAGGGAHEVVQLAEGGDELGVDHHRPPPVVPGIVSSKHRR